MLLRLDGLMSPILGREHLLGDFAKTLSGGLLLDMYRLMCVKLGMKVDIIKLRSLILV